MLGFCARFGSSVGCLLTLYLCISSCAIFFQALKRLITQCQKFFPTDPSRSVDFESENHWLCSSALPLFGMHFLPQQWICFIVGWRWKLQVSSGVLTAPNHYVHNSRNSLWSGHLWPPWNFRMRTMLLLMFLKTHIQTTVLRTDVAGRPAALQEEFCPNPSDKREYPVQNNNQILQVWWTVLNYQRSRLMASRPHQLSQHQTSKVCVGHKKAVEAVIICLLHAWNSDVKHHVTYCSRDQWCPPHPSSDVCVATSSRNATVSVVHFTVSPSVNKPLSSRPALFYSQEMVAFVGFAKYCKPSAFCAVAAPRPWYSGPHYVTPLMSNSPSWDCQSLAPDLTFWGQYPSDERPSPLCDCSSLAVGGGHTSGEGEGGDGPSEWGICTT